MHTVYVILAFAVIGALTYFIYRHNAGRQHGGIAPARSSEVPKEKEKGS